MLYEKALTHLNTVRSGSLSQEESEEPLEKVRAIIEHLDETLDEDLGEEIAAELGDLYEFMLSRLDDDSASARDIATEVGVPLNEVYLGYLELEVRSDAESYFEQHDRDAATALDTAV